MKNLLIGFTLVALAFSSNAMAEKYRIGTEGAYAPWNVINDDGKLVGYEIDLGNALCKAAGVECQFVTNEWDSIIPNLNAGNYDMIMAGMSITDERKKTISFSDEYFPPDPSRFAARKGTTVDWDNIKGLKIGVQGATIQAGYLEENLAKDNEIKSFEKPDQSLADLAAGNIDLLLADGSFLQEPVDASGGELELVGPDISIGGGVGIGIRQKDGELIEKMNQALTALKKDGTVDKLIKEYFKKGPFYAE